MIFACFEVHGNMGLILFRNINTHYYREGDLLQLNIFEKDFERRTKNGD